MTSAPWRIRRAGWRGRLLAHGVGVRPGFFRNAADVRGARVVLGALRQERPDWLVGSFGHEYWPLLALGRSTGVRVALFRHLNAPLKPTSRLLLPRLAHRFIAVSESMRSLLVSRGVSPARVQLLYNPLDCTHFRPDPALRASTRAALGLADEDVVVGYVGPLDAPKGALRLAEAFNQALPAQPRLRALWVGPESAHARLRERILPALQARHLVRGWTSDVRPFYAAMDALAVPSELLESFGRVSIEAQALEVPVLASRIGGLPESLEEGTTGWLLPPGDTGAWRDALVAFALLAPERRRDMGRAGRRFVEERFALPLIASRFAALLEPNLLRPA